MMKFEMFRHVKQAKIHVWFHSDGRINDIFGDLSRSASTWLTARRRWWASTGWRPMRRGRVAFRTDIDRQHVMPFGTPAEVKEEVQRTFNACGTPAGGIIACGEIGPDVTFGQHPGNVRGVPRVRTQRSPLGTASISVVPLSH